MKRHDKKKILWTFFKKRMISFILKNVLAKNQIKYRLINFTFLIIFKNQVFVFLKTHMK